jgi:hypothetical protein
MKNCHSAMRNGFSFHEKIEIHFVTLSLHYRLVFMTTVPTISNATDAAAAAAPAPYPIPKFKNKEEEDEYARTHTRTCSKCNAEKPLTEFENNTSGSQPFDKQGYRLKRPECRDCSRAAKKGLVDAKRAAKKAGIATTPSEHDVCAICNKKGDDRHGLVFDHDHDTNTFRGWLCDPCNRSMGGGHGDKLETLTARFAYICRTDQRHDFVLQQVVEVALAAANRKSPLTSKPTVEEITAFILGQPHAE